MFLAIAFWSLNSTIIKVLGKTEKNQGSVVFMLCYFSSIIAFPVAFMEWDLAFKIGKYYRH